MRRPDHRTLESELARRILVLDGVGRDTAEHRACLEAGADIISTHEDAAATAAARAAADEATERDPARPRFVAGVPELVTAAGVPSRELASACRRQAVALLEGGADLLRIETAADVPQAKAVLLEIRELLEERGAEMPLWITASLGDSAGRTSAGQTLEAFWVSIAHAQPFCVGFRCEWDCDLNAEPLRTHLSELARGAAARLSIDLAAESAADPAGGGRTPAETATALKPLAADGLFSIIGCGRGTTAEHVNAVAQAVRGLAPRRVSPLAPRCRLSGTDTLEIGPDSPFVKIGERTNVSGSARFARLIRKGLHADALEVARRQIRNGAQIIDVNVDDPTRDSVLDMTTFLDLLVRDPEAGRVPVMIDSAHWEVLAAGLERLPGRGIVNSINLKGGDEEFALRARHIRRWGAIPLVMAIDEQGPAMEGARKAEICMRASQLLTERGGYQPQEVILDPGIFAVGTGMPEHADCAVAYMEACRILKEALPGCLISGGVSNLSFAFRGNDEVRGAMHAVFLQHAIPVGMNMGIVNLAQLPPYEEIPAELQVAAEDVVLNRREDGAMRLARLARRPPQREERD